MKLKDLISKYFFILLMLLIALLILIVPEITVFNEYTVHIMIGSFLLGLVLLILSKEKAMLTCFAISGLLAVFLKNESNENLVQPRIKAHQNIKISHYNLTNFQDPFGIHELLLSEDSDIISMQEVTPDWVYLLEQIIPSSYEYQIILDRNDMYGKAIFSKIPILSQDTIMKDQYSDIMIALNIDEQVYHLFTTYITPPLDKLSIEKSNNQLDTIADRINQCTGKIIVMGEYNMVYWSEGVRKFRENTKLKNSRKEIIPAGFKLPYEHIFFSDGLECVSEGSITNKDGEKVGYKGVYQAQEHLQEQINTKIN